MKPLSEQDHYEILEVPRGTSRDGIERAYRLARATFADDSLAAYSIFDGADSAALRERVETAWRVLGNDDSRRAYDASLDAMGEPVFHQQPELAAPEPPAPETPPMESFDEDLDEGGSEWDGARLRRARMRRGLEVDDVARLTKVNPMYLRFLEEERFGELPARVYVRGFVVLYANCVGGAPRSVAETYMRRYDEALRQRRRAR